MPKSQQSASAGKKPKATGTGTEPTVFPILKPSGQIDFYARLQAVRVRYLSEALKKTVDAPSFDLEKLNTELAEYVDSKYLKRLASFGLRGEVCFPVPYLFTQNPYLLARLLSPSVRLLLQSVLRSRTLQAVSTVGERRQDSESLRATHFLLLPEPRGDWGNALGIHRPRFPFHCE